jgi:hypothetical protein
MNGWVRRGDGKPQALPDPFLEQVRPPGAISNKFDVTALRALIRRTAHGSVQLLDVSSSGCSGFAVTGFSRAGKTVFITSAIESLLPLTAGKDTLPG